MLCLELAVANKQGGLSNCTILIQHFARINRLAIGLPGGNGHIYIAFC